jgi:hypothetical protein
MEFDAESKKEQASSDGLSASEARRRPAEVFDVDGRGRRRLDRFGQGAVLEEGRKRNGVCARCGTKWWCAKLGEVARKHFSERICRRCVSGAPYKVPTCSKDLEKFRIFVNLRSCLCNCGRWVFLKNLLKSGFRELFT